jgi:hypothetical protein
MDKQEILDKARKDQDDEGIEFIKKNETSYGVKGAAAIFIILIGFDVIWAIINHQGPDITRGAGLFAMFFGMYGATSLGRYKAGAGKKWLPQSVVGIIAAALFVALYILPVVLS